MCRKEVSAGAESSAHPTELSCALSSHREGGWPVPATHSSLHIPGSPETLGTGRVGDPTGIFEACEETWQWAVWGSVDG